MRPIRNVKKHLIQCSIRYSMLLKNTISTKIQEFLTQTKRSTSSVSVSPAWPTDETMFLFCFRYKKASNMSFLLESGEEIVTD